MGSWAPFFHLHHLGISVIYKSNISGTAEPLQSDCWSIERRKSRNGGGKGHQKGSGENHRKITSFPLCITLIVNRKKSVQSKGTAILVLIRNTASCGPGSSEEVLSIHSQLGIESPRNFIDFKHFAMNGHI